MTGNGRSPDEGIASQRARLASLEACEDQIRALRDRECDLEVEHIAAQAAVHSAAGRLKPSFDEAFAARIGRSLEHRRELEERRRDAGADRGVRRSGGGRKLDELRAGHAALMAWLDASRPREPGRVASAAKVALLIATVVTIWAAITIHPAFLLMLVVIVGPVSFAMGRGQDADWRRVGARRRFEVSGLTDIPVWDEENVRARAAELESLLANTKRVEPEEAVDRLPEHPQDVQALNAQIAEEDRRIAAELAAAGLSEEDTQGETGEWMRLIARADRSHESLERVKRERQLLRAEAVELKDQLRRYLQSQGVKPTEQQDTAAAIAARLDRLSKSD